MMREDEKEMLAAVIDQEGFDYAFRDYSDFGSVEDATFQTLRKAYVDAADALESYIELRKYL